MLAVIKLLESIDNFINEDSELEYLSLGQNKLNCTEIQKILFVMHSPSTLYVFGNPNENCRERLLNDAIAKNITLVV